MALIVTPTGRVIREATPKGALPAAFAAQFSLSHLAWLVTYPIAGWVGTAAGLTIAWSILGGLAVAREVGIQQVGELALEEVASFVGDLLGKDRRHVVEQLRIWSSVIVVPRYLLVWEGEDIG